VDPRIYSLSDSLVESLDRVTVVSEYRLGFGVSLSPNIAQHFAEAILDSFRRRFDAQEEAFFTRLLDPTTQKCTAYNVLDSLTVDEHGWTKVCWWIHERRQLTRLTGRNQLRRYSVHQYTDDACFTVVSNDALIAAMKCWHETTMAFGLRMAIPRKRQVGTRLTWLGFNFYLTSGIVTITPEKSSRALSMIDNIFNGALVTFEEYRRLVGLLEHLLLFVGGD